MSGGGRLTAIGMTAGSALAPLIRPIQPRIADALTQRRAALGTLTEFGRLRPTGRLLWLHGASAGELLGAAPAIRALRKRRDFQLLVTHGSPSGLVALSHLAPDHASYPPLDRPADCDAVCSALRPDLLVVAKLDVWPNMIGSAKRLCVPTALINGTVRDGSGRLRPLARRLLRGAYAALDAVGAVSERDARRLETLGARSRVTRVTGDAAFDASLSRATAATVPGGPRERLEARLPDRPVDGIRLIAGSTWEADEQALLEAISSWSSSIRRRWQVIFAPHEPGEAHVSRLVDACRARGEPVVRWTRLEDPGAHPAHVIVILDELGILAELYTTGDVAYIGGAVGGTGLHNVLEPAAAGLPVLFGRSHDRSDAAALEAAGGGIATTTTALGSALDSVAEDADLTMGGCARAYVEAGAGAGERTAEWLDGLW